MSPKNIQSRINNLLVARDLVTLGEASASASVTGDFASDFLGGIVRCV